MKGSCSADSVVQQLAATLQPTVSLDLWGKISAGMLRTVEHGLTSVMQSLLRVSRDAVHQVLHFVYVSFELVRYAVGKPALASTPRHSLWLAQLADPQQQQLCLTSLAAIAGLATSGFPGAAH